MTNEALSRGLLATDFSYAVKQKLEKLITELSQNPDNLPLLKNIEGIARQVVPIPVGLNLAKTQNTYFEMMNRVRPQYLERAASGHQEAAEWLHHFTELGRCLQFAVDHLRHDFGDHGDHRQAA